MMSSVFLFLLLLNLLPHLCTSEEDRDDERHIYIVNYTGRPISVAWIHPKTRIREIQHDEPHLPNGKTLSRNSFIKHEFEITEFPSTRTNLCLDGGKEMCRKESFTMDDRQHQVVYMRAGFVLEHTVVEVSPTRMMEWLGALAVIFQTTLVLMWVKFKKKGKHKIKIKYRPPPPPLNRKKKKEE